MHANESRFCAVVLFVGGLKCLVQIVFVNVGDQLVSNQLLDFLADKSKISNRAIV